MLEITITELWPSWGRLQPLSPGTATITATFQGVTGSDLVTVSSATLASIAITPNSANVPVQTSLALTATGTFSDGSKTSNVIGPPDVDALAGFLIATNWSVIYAVNMAAGDPSAAADEAAYAAKALGENLYGFEIGV